VACAAQPARPIVANFSQERGRGNSTKVSLKPSDMPVQVPSWWDISRPKTGYAVVPRTDVNEAAVPATRAPEKVRLLNIMRISPPPSVHDVFRIDA
jgi:hypothetical protein